MTRLMKTLALTVVCGSLAALPATAQTHSELQDQIDALQGQITALQNAFPDCMTTASGAGSVDDVIFRGCNVHVQNGQGETDSSNGVGNLIIGYNEDDVLVGYPAPARGGSHNVVIGPRHSYSSYGGLVAGFNNTVSGPHASVSGGGYNEASGWVASVSGGSANKASEWYASVSGGYGNEASGWYASVLGGKDNEASANYSSVSGGGSNKASGSRASVGGGQYNEASGIFASVGGGGNNTASGHRARVSGDTLNASNIATNTSAIAALPALSACMDTVSVSGQDVDDVVFRGCNVHVQNGEGSTDSSNGVGNLIIGYNEEEDDLRSGSHNVVIGPYHSYSSYGGLVAGLHNTVSGHHASVSGGIENTASGRAASVSGGAVNTASGWYASVSGGHENEASDIYASVSGGENNEASEDASSVSGGHQNEASGHHASVSGGDGRTASGTSDWRAGSLFEDD